MHVLLYLKSFEEGKNIVKESKRKAKFQRMPCLRKFSYAVPLIGMLSAKGCHLE